jgi:hypothetical protein
MGLPALILVCLVRCPPVHRHPTPLKGAPRRQETALRWTRALRLSRPRLCAEHGSHTHGAPAQGFLRLSKPQSTHQGPA